MKGVLAMAHADERYVCHAVHSIFSAAYDEPWAEEPRASKLVFIGKARVVVAVVPVWSAPKGLWDVDNCLAMFYDQNIADSTGNDAIRAIMSC